MEKNGHHKSSIKREENLEGFFGDALFFCVYTKDMKFDSPDLIFDTITKQYKKHDTTNKIDKKRRFNSNTQTIKNLI